MPRRGFKLKPVGTTTAPLNEYVNESLVVPSVKPALPLLPDVMPLDFITTSCQPIATQKHEDSGDKDERELWLRLEQQPRQEISERTKAIITCSSNPAVRRSSIKRVKVPELLTIQLGTLVATFELTDSAFAYVSPQTSLTTLPKDIDRKAYDEEPISESGSTTDSESSPRSFGSSTRWSSSSSSSSSGDEELPSEVSTPAVRRIPDSGLPSFENVFPSFAPRSYEAISTRFPRILQQATPLDSCYAGTPLPPRALRRKSPPPISADEVAYLERRARMEKLHKPTRVECGGSSFHIGQHSTAHKREAGASFDLTSGNRMSKEYADGFEAEDEVLIIRNPKPTCRLNQGIGLLMHGTFQQHQVEFPRKSCARPCSKCTSQVTHLCINV